MDTQHTLMPESRPTMIIESIVGEYRRYKKLAEAAIAQVPEDQLCVSDFESGNSIAALVWHLSGNLNSRFTDFLTSDGEKPWRDRESEFEPRAVSREELLEKWNEGWTVLLDSLAQLGDADLAKSVTIRGVRLTVAEALHRSLAHAAYHTGQIVLMAKKTCGKNWHWLSIAPGESAAYNQNPTREKPLK